MFNLHDFIIKGLRGAIGFMPDYQIRLSAVGYLEKAILTEEDLAALDTEIDAHTAEEVAE